MDSKAFSFGICDRHKRFRYISSTLVEGLRCLVLVGTATGTLSDACEFTVHRRRCGRLLVTFVRLASENKTYFEVLQLLLTQ